MQGRESRRSFENPYVQRVLEIALSICQCEVFLVIRIVISRWSADVLLTEGIRCLEKLAGINAFTIHYRRAFYTWKT